MPDVPSPASPCDSSVTTVSTAFTNFSSAMDNVIGQPASAAPVDMLTQSDAGTANTNGVVTLVAASELMAVDSSDHHQLIATSKVLVENVSHQPTVACTDTVLSAASLLGGTVPSAMHTGASNVCKVRC